ncbi:hypothetical protein N7466_010133 [Penicillium verhagenii]|uniref:uncharacterized protein n=1 Tax=Penicillium verhagenii TaxID=1562060 RepID=UPI002545B4C5|nr:uncharacterized protein N7466_010133 [Penicillium verhagenii]KAJ5919190.1 hypothetical protein N7466_010133 [Penicillium verhagenii]
MFWVCFLIATLGLACQAAPVTERQADGSSFGLYAYGENITGLPVFYADVTANATDSYTWIAHVNNTLPTITTRTLDTNAQNFGPVANSSTTLLLCLGQTNSTSPTNPVTFVNSDESAGKIVDTFTTYAYNVLLKQADTGFFGKSNGDGTYSLLWSTVRDNGYIPLIIKTVGVWKQPVLMNIGV